VHNTFRLRAPALPAPLHLAAGLLTAQGVSWSERFAAARFLHRMRRARYQLEHDITVSALLAAHEQGAQLTAHLWNPLCVAALNTPPEQASAQVFLNVLRDGLDAERAASNLILARGDLSSLFPEPAARYVQAHGGNVHTGTRVTAIDQIDNGFEICARDNAVRHTHIICAVAPHHAQAFLTGMTRLSECAERVARLRYQPIYTVYLKFAEAVTLPAPMLGLAGGLTQWVFDRGAISGERGLLAAIISAEGKHQALTLDQLAQQVCDELRIKLNIRAALTWQRVIAEKRATFACTPGLQRPPQQTALKNFYLAGDYTAGDYPATLEAAVRSGITGAQHIIASHSRHEHAVMAQPAAV